MLTIACILAMTLLMAWVVISVIYEIKLERSKQRILNAIENVRKEPIPKDLPRLVVNKYSNSTLRDNEGNVLADLGKGVVITKTNADGSVSKEFIKDNGGKDSE